MSNYRKTWHNLFKCGNYVTFCMVLLNAGYAITYDFPTGANIATPPQTLANNDVLNINSSLFQTTNSTNFTVNSLQNSTINIATGATLSYSGTNPTGGAIYSNRSNSATQLVDVSGTLSAGTSNNAINFINTNAANNDLIDVVLNDGATINGNITATSIKDLRTCILGHGTINGNIATTNLSTQIWRFRIGYDPANNPYPNSSFTTNGTINSGIYSASGIYVSQDSTLTINHETWALLMEMQTGSTVYINTPYTGAVMIAALPSTLVLGADVTLNGNFFGAGTQTNLASLTTTRNVNYSQEAISSFILYGDYTAVMTDQENYGNLTLTGSVGPHVNNFAITYNGGYFSSGTYTIFSADSSFINTPTASTPPANTFLMSFSPLTIGASAVTVNITTSPLQNLTTNMVNYEIATVLQNYSPYISSQSILNLYDALSNSASIQIYNDNLAQLAPNINASSANFALQNSAINLVERRAIGLSNQAGTVGIATGDVYYNMATWLGTFGNFGRQHASGENNGYKLASIGGLLGFDYLCDYEDVYGLAMGVSNAKVTEAINDGFNTNVTNYNLLVYGANQFPHSTFIEWIISGAINYATGNRAVNISNNNFATSYSVHSWLASPKINLGAFVDLNSQIRLSQISSVQYAYMHQPNYAETGSITALHVSPSAHQNLLTVGTGGRVSNTGDYAWEYGYNELRAMVTYDVIIPNRNIAANFIFGGDTFTITNPEARLAFHLGGDLGVSFYGGHVQLQLRADYEIRRIYYDVSLALALRYLF